MADYTLDEQVGFQLRRANQRHRTIFAGLLDIAPAQFSAMTRLYEVGEVSQNLLGRLIAADGATIKGVVDRLGTRGLVSTRPDPDDGRRLLVSLTATGREKVKAMFPVALQITAKTMEPLNREERAELVRLLAKIAGPDAADNVSV